KRVDTVLPVRQGLASSWYCVRTADAQALLEQRRIRLLHHEQWNVLENVAVVETKASAQQEFSRTSRVISEADTRAEVLRIVLRWLDIRICQRVVQRCQFQIGRAICHCRASHQVEVTIPPQAQVHGQALRQLPVILEIETQLLCAAR